jgi:hypothetical protein
MLFILFGLEIALLFPWAVTLNDRGRFASNAMMVLSAFPGSKHGLCKGEKGVGMVAARFTGEHDGRQ